MPIAWVRQGLVPGTASSRSSGQNQKGAAKLQQGAALAAQLPQGKGRRDDGGFCKRSHTQPHTATPRRQGRVPPAYKWWAGGCSLQPPGEGSRSVLALLLLLLSPLRGRKPQRTLAGGHVEEEALVLVHLHLCQDPPPSGPGMLSHHQHSLRARIKEHLGSKLGTGTGATITFGQGETGEREKIYGKLSSQKVDLARPEKRQASFSKAKGLPMAGPQPLG